MTTEGSFTLADLHTPFTIHVDQLKLGTIQASDIEVAVSYDQRWRVHIDLSPHITFQQSMSVMSTDDMVDDPALYLGAMEVPILLKRVSVGIDNGSAIVEATLQREPLEILAGEKYTEFSATMLSPPRFSAKDFELKGSDGTCFTVIPMKENGLEFAKIRVNSPGETSSLSRRLDELFDFMTFVKGAYCGIGHIVAKDEIGNETATVIGFFRNDDGKREVNWFDLHIQKNLPAIFSKFSEAMNDELLRQAIRQALGFYRASNVSREFSIEMSIIASHSALEALVNYILEYRAKWSRALSSEKSLRFCDKLRAAAAFQMPDRELFEHSPILASLCKSRSGIDAYEAISFIRNKIVHQDKKYKPKGLELHEAWLLMQWLVESLMFSLIKYKGEIIDRRPYSGWSGQLCTVDYRD